MIGGYGLIASLTTYADAIQKALEPGTFEREDYEGATYFIVTSIDWSQLDESPSGGLGEVLNAISEEDYSLAMTHEQNSSIIMHGNYERFGIKGILAYGNERQSRTH